MTPENREILNRINKYSEVTLGEIDPQKVPVSVQLEALKPVMEEIAKEKNLELTDVFILYMDLQSEASCASQAKLAEDLQDLGEGEGSKFLFR